MRVGSLFSGIGGLDCGLARAGHEHVFFCEVDPWRREVLAARWPGVPVFEDVQALRAGDDGAWPAGIVPRRRTVGGSDGSAAADGSLVGPACIDLLCGGFPCQDVSVAGRRAGLAGERTGLFFELTRIAESLRPEWLLLENVPGLFSSNGGRDFGVVLGTLADLGYGVAWRVLDSRFFGVPQRRRRVFIVGALADGDPRAAAARAGEVLAVGSGCPRHLAPRGEAREEVAGTLGGGAGERGWSQDVERMTFLPIADTVRSHPRPGSNSNGNLTLAAPLTKGSATGEGVNQPGRRQEDDVNLVPLAGPLGGGNDGIGRRTEDDPNLVAVPISGDALRGEGTAKTPSADAEGNMRLRDPGLGIGEPGDPAFTLSATSPGAVGVRRLTPTECERLQGLPDGWTQLGETPDSRRYSALGDAVTATVAEWIGHGFSSVQGEHKSSAWVVEFVCGHRWSSEWHKELAEQPVRCPVCGESEVAYAEGSVAAVQGEHK